MEQTSYDGVSVYPASDRKYAYYFNQMFKIHAYDEQLNTPFFNDKDFTNDQETAVGFSHLRQTFRFKEIKVGLNRDQDFYGINKEWKVSFGLISNTKNTSSFKGSSVYHGINSC